LAGSVEIAPLQEELRALDRPGQLAGSVEIAPLQDHLVGFHHVDLQRNALRPRAPELGGWDTGVEQQGSLGARTRLGQHLRGQHPERKPRIDDLVRQAVGCQSTALDYGVEADLIGAANAVGELVKILPSYRSGA